MKHASIRRTHLLHAAVIISSLACFLWQPLHAQVVIKDTVVISPRQRGEAWKKPSLHTINRQNLKSLSPLTPTGIVMPIAGQLTVQYVDAFSDSYPIPPASCVSVTESGRTRRDTSLIARLPRDTVVLEQWCPCEPPPPPCTDVQRFWYEGDTLQFPTDWEVGVLSGETVACSTLAPTGQPIGTEYVILISDTSQGIYSWLVIFHTADEWYCNPVYKFAQELYAWLVLRPDTVMRFSAPDSMNVYPTYSGRNNTPATRNYIDLELRVSYGNDSIPNSWVHVQRPILVESGGHSHNGDRPMGRYIYPISPDPDTSETVTAQTDSEGKLRFRYLASQFGGVERIRARLVSDTTKFDTLSLKTRVPGLQPVVDGTNYDLVGGTCRHHGPGGPAGCTTPDNNHFAAQVVRDSLPLMTTLWVDSLEQDALFINDISLPYGGLFDVGGSWRPEHSEHREGLDVDIRTAIPGSRDGVRVRNSQGKWVGNNKFEKLSKKYGVKKAGGHKEGTDEEHYHLDY